MVELALLKLEPHASEGLPLFLKHLSAIKGINSSTNMLQTKQQSCFLNGKGLPRSLLII